MTSGKETEKKTGKKGKSKMHQLEDLKVEDILDQRIWDLSMLTVDSEVGSAIKILTSTSHVWIVDDLEKKRLKGIITRNDLFNILKPRGSLHLSKLTLDWKGYFDFDDEVRRFMDTAFITVRLNDYVVDVLDKMCLHRIHNVAVADGRKHLIGEVSFKRILGIYVKLHLNRD